MCERKGSKEGLPDDRAGSAMGEAAAPARGFDREPLGHPPLGAWLPATRVVVGDASSRLESALEALTACAAAFD